MRCEILPHEQLELLLGESAGGFLGHVSI